MSEHERQTETAASSASKAPAAASSAPAVEGAGKRSEASPAADTASQGPGLTAAEAFEIECLNSARYHEDREQFFSFLNKSTLFFVVAMGTAALSPLKDRFPVLIPILITLAGLLNLVFDIAGKARLHASLKKAVFSILAETKMSHDLCDLQRKLVLVYADEPPTMYAVNAVAYNGAMLSRDRPSKYLIKIGVWARFWRHIWPYAANSFKTYEELGLAP